MRYFAGGRGVRAENPTMVDFHHASVFVTKG